MGLFNKKKQNFNPTKQYVPEIVYDEKISDNLLKTVGRNSKDVKRVEVHYDDDVIVYIFDSGTLKSVESTENPLELMQRFYWTDKNTYDEKILEEIAEYAKEHSFVEIYTYVLDNRPEFLDMISTILWSQSLRNVLNTVDKPVQKIVSDIIVNDFEKVVKSSLFMSYSIDNLDKAIEEEVKREEAALSELTTSPLEHTLLETRERDFLPTDIDKIIEAASDSEASLGDIKNLSQGFLFSRILVRIVELKKLRILNVKDPLNLVDFDGDEDELPSFEDFDEDNDAVEDAPLEQSSAVVVEETSVDVENANKDDEVSNFDTSVFVLGNETEVESGDVSGAESTEPVDEHDTSDDGGFDFSEVPQDSSVTAYVGDGLTDALKIAMGENNCEKDVVKQLSQLLRDNDSMENDIAVLDKEIAVLHKNYDNVFAEYQLSSVGRVVSDETRNLNSEDLVKLRSDANKTFEDLYMLEEERQELGVKRKKVLSEIKQIVSSFTIGNAQQLVHWIELKIEAIDEVTNKALHTAKDDEDLAANSIFAVNGNDVQEVNTDDDEDVISSYPPLSANYSVEDAPLFDSLLDKYGVRDLLLKGHKQAG